MIKLHYAETTIIAGIATAGIAHGVLAAEMLNLPYCYVRPEPKKHGMRNQIEGYMEQGAKVVLVEDLISTGKSSLQAADAVREAGGEVVGLVALFSYGFEDARQRFVDANVPYQTISQFDVLVHVAAESGYLNPEKLEIVKNFAKDPANWNR